MTAHDFYRPNASCPVWPINLLAASDAHPERWRIYHLKLSDTCLVPDERGIRRNTRKPGYGSPGVPGARCC